MKNLLIKLSILFCVAFSGCTVSANTIDDKCPQLTYKHAPTVKADQYLCRNQYAVAYSYVYKNPIYTTEFLTASHTGKLPRTNDFRVDPSIPKQFAANPSDYINQKGCFGMRCDRGHMTPDQDFSACVICVSESFLMSNMVPQNFKNNEVIWKDMEIAIRKYVAKGNDVYVITGPVYAVLPVPTIGANKVSVPSHLFKMVIDAKTSKSIAFYMDNNDIDPKLLQSKVVSIDVIEKASGIVFESTLDKKSTGLLALFK
jgi:endonuclease G